MSEQIGNERAPWKPITTRTYDWLNDEYPRGHVNSDLPSPTGDMADALGRTIAHNHPELALPPQGISDFRR